MNYLITISHARSDILEHGLQKCNQTFGDVKCEKYLVDHHWPIEYWKTRHDILNLAEKYGYRVMSPYKNLGGHDGFTWAVNELKISSNDIVIGMDPDSNPYTYGWGNAMVEALQDKRLAFVSLHHDHLANRPYEVTEINHQKVGILPHADMINVTGWNGLFLRMSGGLKGSAKFYGGVEVPMFTAARQAGMTSGYLMDFKETVWECNIDEIYTKWKHAHIFGDNRNFDEFVKDHS